MGSHGTGTSLGVRAHEPAPRRPSDRGSGKPADGGTPLDVAIARARESLLRQQHPDGHWCGLLEGDSILESEYVLLHHFLGRGEEEKAVRAARRVRQLQNPDGGWSIYPGGPPDVSASIKAYFVLKLAGDAADAPHMLRARERIRALGGIEAANTYTKIYLALFGQWEWARCPAVPPEMMLLPEWSPLHVGRMSSWSRAIFVPLSIVWALRPRVAVPVSIAELRGGRGRAAGPALLAASTAAPPAAAPGPTAGAVRPRRHRDRLAGASWRTFFRVVDRGLWAGERARLTPLRRRALRAADAWLLAHVEGSDGVGAVFPSIANTIMAFHCLGRGPDDPAMAAQLEALRKHEVERGDTLLLQPSLSPVWDTAQSVAALLAAGLPASHPALARATDWLLQREVRRGGDWCAGNPTGPVGGWYFQYANEPYPDCDDTAEVLEALRPLAAGAGERAGEVRGARARGRAWLLSMQNRDGGWGAFDRGCDLRPLEHIPFADHNAMLDPSTADVTGRVVEMLVTDGLPSGHPALRRAAAFLRQDQDDDGTWYGRWGCNRIYGSWLALSGLAAVGEPPGSHRFARCAAWLRAHQNPDGGWGETPGSYWDPALRGRGPSTAAQTAWALLGLLAAGEPAGEVVYAGLGYLMATQRADGSWLDESWTATGFPKVFFLQYHLYDDYFPLLALARWREALREEQP